jgi:5'(3')-deoxyribonucleotidase
MVSLYVTGVSLRLCYGLAMGATALSSANAASIALAGTCLVMKLIKDKRRPVSTENKRLRIAIDMDETIADSLKEHIRRYNSAFAEKIAADDLRGKHLEEFVPVQRSDAVRRMIRDESFFECLGVIREAQQVIRDLAREHEVFIVSAAMEVPESFAAKHRWLQRHFPFIPTRKVVFCGDKGIIDADYLIDDEARHFVSFRGTGILFSAPHNLLETAYERVASWQDLRRKFVWLQNNRDSDEAEPVGVRKWSAKSWNKETEL